jgi:hypothetical protein
VANHFTTHLPAIFTQNILIKCSFSWIYITLHKQQDREEIIIVDYSFTVSNRLRAHRKLQIKQSDDKCSKAISKNTEAVTLEIQKSYDIEMKLAGTPDCYQRRQTFTDLLFCGLSQLQCTRTSLCPHLGSQQHKNGIIEINNGQGL